MGETNPLDDALFAVQACATDILPHRVDSRDLALWWRIERLRKAIEQAQKLRLESLSREGRAAPQGEREE